MRHAPHDPVHRINDKHRGELLAVARTLGGHPGATDAQAEGVDSLGIDLLLVTPTGQVAARVDFAEPVSDPRRMRAAFRELTRRAALVSGSQE